MLAKNVGRAGGRLLLVLLCCVTTAQAVRAQEQGFKVEDVITLLASGVAEGRVVQLAQGGCVAFLLDAGTEQRLRAAGAGPGLLDGLRAACYTGPTLSVSSATPGVEVSLQGAVLGKTPLSMPVAAMQGARLEGRGPGWSQTAIVDLLPGQQVQVRLEAPEPLLPLPDLPPTREALARQLGLGEQWQPTTPRPVMPAAPRPTRRVRVLGTAAGLGLGYVAAREMLQAPPEGACGELYDYTRGQYYQTCYEPTDYRGRGAAVVATATATGFLTGWLFERLRLKARQRRYEQDTARYPEVLVAWEQRQEALRREWLATHPQLDEAVARARQQYEAERTRVEAENAAREARNRPVVTVVPKGN